MKWFPIFETVASPSNGESNEIGALLILLLIGISVWWAFKDGEERGKNGCLVALMVLLLFWPLSLLVWLVFRPERNAKPILQKRHSNCRNCGVTLPLGHTICAKCQQP